MDIQEIIGFLKIFGVILLLSLIFSLIFICGCTRIIITLDTISCKKTAEKLNYKCEYSIWTGCVLENAKGHKFLLEQLRNLQLQEVE